MQRRYSVTRSAENFLFEEGAITRRSEQRRQILGCLACQWKKTLIADGAPAAYGQQIVNCTGLESGVIYPSLKRLRDAEALKYVREERGDDPLHRPRRNYISPADGELGESLAQYLAEVPEDCPPLNFSEEQMEIDEIIVSSSRPALQYLIDQAQQRLAEIDNPEQHS